MSPLYLYYCRACDQERDVMKPMEESGKDEICQVCGNLMLRNYDYGSANFNCDMSHTASEGKPVAPNPNGKPSNYKMGKFIDKTKKAKEHVAKEEKAKQQAKVKRRTK